MFLSVFWLFCRMNAARSSGRSWVDFPTVWRDPNTPQRELAHVGTVRSGPSPGPAPPAP